MVKIIIKIVGKHFSFLVYINWPTLDMKKDTNHLGKEKSYNNKFVPDLKS